MKLEGTFMKAGVRNSNGNIYNAEQMAKAFAEYQKKVDAGEAFGRIIDIDHPEASFSENISDISHKITEVSFNKESGTISGKIELLDTPSGKIAQGIIKETKSLDIGPCMIVEPRIYSTDSKGGMNNENKVNEYDVVQIQSFDICRESAWPDAKVKPIEEDKE